MELVICGVQATPECELSLGSAPCVMTNQGFGFGGSAFPKMCEIFDLH